MSQKSRIFGLPTTAGTDLLMGNLKLWASRYLQHAHSAGRGRFTESLDGRPSRSSGIATWRFSREDRISSSLERRGRVVAKLWWMLCISYVMLTCKFRGGSSRRSPATCICLFFAEEGRPWTDFQTSSYGCGDTLRSVFCVSRRLFERRSVVGHVAVKLC